MKPGTWESKLNLKRSVPTAMLQSNLVVTDAGAELMMVQVTQAVDRAQAKEVVVQVLAV
jgi:hypothetical protein